MLVPFFPKAENLEQSQWRRPFAEAGLGNGRAMSSVMHEAPGSFSGCGSSSLCCSDVSWLLAQNQRNQSRGEGAVLQAMGRVGGVAFNVTNYTVLGITKVTVHQNKVGYSGVLHNLCFIDDH